MTNKEKKKIRDKIADIFNRHLDFLGITNYEFYIYFPGESRHKVSEGSSYLVEVEDPYRSILLHVQEHTVNNFKKIPLKNTKTSLLHEAIHVLMWRFRELAYSRYTYPAELHEAEEDLTDQIKSIVIRALKNKSTSL